MLEPRAKSYIWPTWIADSLSGDAHCEWKLWAKAHYDYDKLEDDGDMLSRYQQIHDELLKVRVKMLQDEGWDVSVEDQNKFTLRGRSAVVGGKPDIVATRDDELLISDAKSGKRKPSHVWQVRTYMTLLPAVNPELREMIITGELFYSGNKVSVVTLEPDDTARIFETVRMLGDGPEPPTTPSPRECRLCNISECGDRIKVEEQSSDTAHF